MLDQPRRPSPSTTRAYGRGITGSDVDRAADSLLRAGERPTIEKVRLKIGRGSPNTINPLLDAWWQRLAGRLDAGPAALHRLPEPVAHAAEGLWLTALEEARRRAQLESGSTRKTLARERQDLEVQDHVLSIREGELRDRIAQAESRASQLAIEIDALTTLLRKEQASRLAVERRLTETQSDLEQALTHRRRGAGARLKPVQQNAKALKRARKSPRARVATTRTVTTERKPR